jgi:hypothetical protein
MIRKIVEILGGGREFKEKKNKKQKKTLLPCPKLSTTHQVFSKVGIPNSKIQVLIFLCIREGHLRCRPFGFEIPKAIVCVYACAHFIFGGRGESNPPSGSWTNSRVPSHPGKR